MEKTDHGAQSIRWTMRDTDGNRHDVRSDGSAMVELPATGKLDGKSRVYNLDHSPMARMRRSGTLSDSQYKAAEQFAEDFYHARLYGGFAMVTRIDRATKSGGYQISDRMVASRARIDAALNTLTPIGQRLIWYLVGNHDTMDAVAWRLSGLCGSVNRHHVAGMLIMSLETLARHYRTGGGE